MNLLYLLNYTKVKLLEAKVFCFALEIIVIVHVYTFLLNRVLLRKMN